MSKVLVFGQAPLPFEDIEKSYGPGARTWQLSKPLIEDGHEVTILASRIPFTYDESLPEVQRSEEHGCEIYRVFQWKFEDLAFTRELVGSLDPDCVVGASAFPSFIAVMSAGDRPVWADVYGCLLAEAQAKAYVYKDDSFLEHFISIMNPILDSADALSAVSKRQKFELIGELATHGRLNSKNYGFDFVSVIPVGIEDIEFPPCEKIDEGIGEDDFVVLWSGGFNTWTDVDVLFEGLERAMKASGRIHFVSTGGEILGHDEKTYPRFQKIVSASKYRDRFHLKGWVKRSEALSYYNFASVGINMDSLDYEVLLGSRKRILEWALAGLPAVSASLCELAGDFAKEGLLFPITVGDPVSLSDTLLELEEAREKISAVRPRLQEFARENYSFGKTTLPLREWVRNPEHLPDFKGRQFSTVAADPAPPITPESSWGEKFSFYMKHEGASNTLKRSVRYLMKKVRGR
ncbi:MAG: glycosyltransferase family 4 protein [Actinomycetota bacterium]|nr:glycosyltransferase family 4 protein [Actinomycetota bacterium]